MDYPLVPTTDDYLDAFVETAIAIRRELPRLRDTRDAFLDTLVDVSRLRRENAALKASIAYLMAEGGHLPPPHIQPTPKLSTLPSDVVRHIFDETIPPAYLYERSITRGPGNPWLQVLSTKKALPLICTQHSWLGMATLYKNIALRRMGQIFALSNTLRSPRGPAIAYLVKSINIEGCPISIELADSARKELAFIFQQCGGLRSVTYRPHDYLPVLDDDYEIDSSEGYFSPTWIFDSPTLPNGPPLIGAALASNLQHLDLPITLTDTRLRGLHDFLCMATSLRTLVLGCPGLFETTFTDITALPMAHLSHLHELHIHFGFDNNFDKYVCTKWEMPSLSHLTTVVGYWDWPGPLLERFGAHLLFLHLYPWEIPPRNFCAHNAYPDLSTYCPKLEHFIAPNPHLCDDASPTVYLHSPTIKHLDFWEFDNAMRLFYQRILAKHSNSPQMIQVSSENLPSLRTVCMILSYYIGNCCDVDWPTICHPTLLLDRHPSEVIWHRFPNVWVAQTSTALVPGDSSSPMEELGLDHSNDLDSDSSFTRGSSESDTDVSGMETDNSSSDGTASEEMVTESDL